MVKIPKLEDDPHRLNYMLNKTTIKRERRSNRLGMAAIGNPCLRAMWLKFRWGREVELPRRVKRIFALGDACEIIVIDALKELGLEITDQQEEVAGWGGHIWGYTDGRITKVPGAEKTVHLLEVKSMNDRIFKTVKKDGVIEAKHEHYVQMTNYMGKLNLERALYCAINKNDSEIHTERIRFCKTDYKEFMSRGIDVISHEIAPPNLFQTETAQACKWCDFVPICYQGEPALKSCRTCVRVDIEDEGKWSCNLHQKELSFEEQQIGCDQYRPLEIK